MVSNYYLINNHTGGGGGSFQSTIPVVTVASYSFPLMLSFFLVCCLAALSIGRVIYFKHKILSFQMAFLLLAFVWSAMRGVMLLFLALFEERSPMAYQLMLWIPLVAASMAFSLLIVHYGSVLNHENWESGARTRHVVMYWSLNGAFLVGHLVPLIIGFTQPEKEEFLMLVELIFSSCFHTFLAILIAVQGGLILTCLLPMCVSFLFITHVCLISLPSPPHVSLSRVSFVELCQKGSNCHYSFGEGNHLVDSRIVCCFCGFRLLDASSFTSVASLQGGPILRD